MSGAGRSAVDVERVVLVCGVGRSGTSLLMGMLNAHPELSFPPETHFFRRYVARRAARLRREAEGASAFAAELERDADFARARVPVAAVLEDERGHGLDLGRVYRRLLRLVAEREGTPRVGDKDPRNLDFLRALARELPEARVLHVVRDPRDVVLSRTKAAWSAGRPWWAHALVAREQLRRGRALGPALLGERWMELRYEELIASPEETLRSVCAHCGLDFDAAMLDFGASAARLVDERELQWKREVLGPLLAANSGKWRQGLSPLQVRWVEAVCRESFEELGYLRAEPGTALPAGQRALVGAAPLARAATSLAYGLRGTLGGAA